MARVRDFTSPLAGILGAIGGSFIPGIGPSAGYRAGYGLGEAASSYLGGPRNQPRGYGANQQLMNQELRGQQGGGRYNVVDLPRGAQGIEAPLYSAADEAALGQLRDRGLAALSEENLPKAEFGPIESEMLRQYEQQIVPQLMEQFRGADAFRTGGFQQSLGSAATGLQSKLAAMKQMFEQQRRGQQQTYGMGLAKAGLGRKYQLGLLEPPQSDGDSIGTTPGLLQSLGAPSSLGKLFSYLLEEKEPEKETRRNQLEKAVRAMAYKKLREQASLQPGNEGY